MIILMDQGQQSKGLFTFYIEQEDEREAASLKKKMKKKHAKKCDSKLKLVKKHIRTEPQSHSRPSEEDSYHKFLEAVLSGRQNQQQHDLISPNKCEAPNIQTEIDKPKDPIFNDKAHYFGLNENGDKPKVVQSSVPQKYSIPPTTPIQFSLPLRYPSKKDIKPQRVVLEGRSLKSRSFLQKLKTLEEGGKVVFPQDRFMFNFYLPKSQVKEKGKLASNPQSFNELLLKAHSGQDPRYLKLPILSNKNVSRRIVTNAKTQSSDQYLCKLVRLTPHSKLRKVEVDIALHGKDESRGGLATIDLSNHLQGMRRSQEWRDKKKIIRSRLGFNIQ